MKVALVYDRVNKWGGAERTLLAFHKIFPKATLFTSVYDSKGAPWAKVFPEVKTTFLQKIPFIKSTHELFGWLMPIAFETLNFNDYDLVISVSSEAAKGVITKSPTLHVCYCLTPTRYLWSGHDFYFKNPPTVFKIFPFFWWLSRPFVAYTRLWDKIAAQKPDKMVAISTEVKRRIKKYYGRDSTIIFPPRSSSMNQNIKPREKKYYLILGRIIPYKRVDVAIEAFNKLGYPLLIVGSGTEVKKLKALVKSKKIKFIGQIKDDKLADYYRGAKALIMPQEEDFGIVAVEAQAYGTPVVAFANGGAADTVIDGKTGILFKKQTVESLISAVKKFEKMNFLPDNLYTNAKRFSFRNFRRGILETIK